MIGLPMDAAAACAARATELAAASSAAMAADSSWATDTFSYMCVCVCVCCMWVQSLWVVLTAGTCKHKLSCAQHFAKTFFKPSWYFTVY